MAKVYKSARGKMIDMDKVKLAQETTVAVGNMRVNARGDALGSGGQVVAGRNQIMDQVYAVNSAPSRAKAVAPPPPSAGYSPNDPAIHSGRQAALEASKAQALHDLANSLLDQNKIVEPVVNTDQPVVPPARGTLAGSVAKTVTVTQGPAETPREIKKNEGPKRI
jgi:hypothetical protein